MEHILLLGLFLNTLTIWLWIRNVSVTHLINKIFWLLFTFLFPSRHTTSSIRLYIIQNYELTYHLIERMDRLNERMIFNSFGHSLKHFGMNYYKPVPRANSVITYSVNVRTWTGDQTKLNIAYSLADERKYIKNWGLTNPDRWRKCHLPNWKQILSQA